MAAANFEEARCNADEARQKYEEAVGISRKAEKALDDAIEMSHLAKKAKRKADAVYAFADLEADVLFWKSEYAEKISQLCETAELWLKRADKQGHEESDLTECAKELIRLAKDEPRRFG